MEGREEQVSRWGALLEAPGKGEFIYEFTWKWTGVIYG